MVAIYFSSLWEQRYVKISEFEKRGSMKESILIVEDEVEIGNILKMELEHEGYQVKIKNNGR